MKSYEVFTALTLLLTAHCSDDRLLTQYQFCELLRDQAEQEYPGIVISGLDERGFDYVRGTGDRGRLTVTEEYNYYTQHPGSLDDLVNRLVSLLATQERLKRVSQNQERIHRSLMPVIKTRLFLADATARAGGHQMLYGEHGTGLLVFYVIDEPTSMSYLTVGSLPDLGLTLRQLNDRALANLARRTGVDRYVVEQTESGPMAVGDTRDGYDAARLVSPGLFLTLTRVLDTSSIILSVPRRDLMLAVSSTGSSELVQHLRERALNEFSAGPYAIAPHLFLFDREGLRVYREDQ